MDTWQPIETAPLNESVLVYIPNAEHYGEPIYRAIKIFFEGRQNQPYWTSTALHCGRDIAGGYEPTYWMPLPEPPQAIAGQYLKRAAAAIVVLTDEERLDLFSDYCRGCGTANLPCHCQNDE